MIAAAAHYRFVAGERLDLAAEADPGLRLDTRASSNGPPDHQNLSRSRSTPMQNRR